LLKISVFQADLKPGPPEQMGEVALTDWKEGKLKGKVEWGEEVEGAG
jgi:hypothetical protein